MQPQAPVNAFDKDQALQAYALLQAYADGTHERATVMDFPGIIQKRDSNLSAADAAVGKTPSDIVMRGRSNMLHALVRDTGRAQDGRGRVKARALQNEVQTLRRLALTSLQTSGAS